MSRRTTGTLVLTLLVVAIVLGMSQAVAASMEQASALQQNPVVFKTYDEVLRDAGRLAPGFGGVFLDRNNNSIAYVYMKDASKAAAARVALRHVMGVERFNSIRQVQVLQADYDMEQLYSWYERAWPVALSLPGTVSSDLNEGKNRLGFKVEDAGAKASLEEKLVELGIPSEAVVVELGERLRFLAHGNTLLDRIRPLEAGTEVRNPFAEPGACSLGFNAIRTDGSGNMKAGIVVGSHCTDVQWGADPQPVFSQPSGGDRIGTETIDPSGAQLSGCPVDSVGTAIPRLLSWTQVPVVTWGPLSRRTLSRQR
ncbi:MAG: hypothetical protein HY681_04960 [Chloroflexi bacterium]|nr:hypothetical protein [Chloroflexota bacterium]